MISLHLQSWMFVPGHSQKMIDKSLSLPLGAVMLDLEDGVVPDMKAQARPVVATSLQRPQPDAGPSRYVRVNGIDTPYFSDDLHNVVVDGLEGLVLPKTDTVDQVHAAAAMLDKLELARGIARGSIKLMLAIETATAIIAAPQLAAASERVSGLMFGAEDFSRDIGLPTVRTGVARDFTYARSAIVVAAAAAGVASIDGVWPDLEDKEGLARDTHIARDLGFTGKSLIHPGQIDTINDRFRPTKEEVAFARELIEEFEQALAEGRGSIKFGGQLVDRPIYERARATVRALDEISGGA